ncbi:MAG: phosphatase PAP2 family protein [Candidatus Saccharibacteria bacterium]|nr:phosphatase PAP2 family protein [Pseudorhodobacter sp.]
MDRPGERGFLTDRMAVNAITGLPLTMLVLASGFFLTFYATGILGAASPNWMVRSDMTLAGVLADMRTPWLVGFFAIITAFGYWAVIFTLIAAASILLWLRGQSHCLVGLWIAVLGNQVTVTALKMLFRRARPDLGLFDEHSFSFPSGHAAISAAFFGFLVYLVVRQRIVSHGPAVLAGGLAILLVGTSRLVLGEHYLSDVLGGYLVGATWVVIGIWLTERRSDSNARSGATDPWRRLAVYAVVLCTAIALYFTVEIYVGNLLSAETASPE